MTFGKCVECGFAITIANCKFCPTCGTTLNDSSTDTDLQSYTFTPRELEGLKPNSLSFRNSWSKGVQFNSEAWFPGPNRTIKEIAAAKNISLPEWIPEDFSLGTWFGDEGSYLAEYEPINWEQSRFGKRFVDQLNARGLALVHGNISTRVAAEVEGKNLDLAISDEIDLYTGRWTLSDGSEFLQKGQIFQNRKTKEEIVFWHIDALASSRPTLSYDTFDISKLVMIPHLLQSACYLAETPFPSTNMVSFSRSIASENADISKLRPAVRFQRDAYLLGLFPSSALSLSQDTRVDGRVPTDGRLASLAVWAPELIQFGYIFKESMSDQEIYELLRVACDGLPKILEILTDGYCNWPTGTELDFQASLLSDAAFASEEDDFCSGKWIPGTIYSQLFKRGLDLYDTSYESLQKSLERKDASGTKESLKSLENIARRGTGSIFLHAANTLAHTAIENDIELDSPIEAMLYVFKEIDVDSQGFNALSNLILLKTRRGFYFDAVKFIEQALPLCLRRFPNLNTKSHFTSIDGSNEISIAEEVYENALICFGMLAKKEDLLSTMNQIRDFCREHKSSPLQIEKFETLFKSFEKIDWLPIKRQHYYQDFEDWIDKETVGDESWVYVIPRELEDGSDQSPKWFLNAAKNCQENHDRMFEDLYLRKAAQRGSWEAMSILAIRRYGLGFFEESMRWNQRILNLRATNVHSTHSVWTLPDESIVEEVESNIHYLSSLSVSSTNGDLQDLGENRKDSKYTYCLKCGGRKQSIDLIGNCDGTTHRSTN
jgi:hypothetical protein